MVRFAGNIKALAAAVFLCCSCSGLAPSDSNAPTGWATCGNISGGSFDLSGGQGGRKTVLLSDGSDMRSAIEQALREYDIVILDGSAGPFLYSESSYFDSLRNKTIAGINGAVIKTGFQCTPEIKAAFAASSDKYSSVEPGPDGRYMLSNGVAARNVQGFRHFQSIIDLTGDTSMRFAHSGVWCFRSGCGNLIIRNIFFDGPGAFRGKPDTMLRFRDGCDHVWVDHCTFEDPGCIAMSVSRQADCITASWCEFRFTEQSNGHELGVLVSSGDESWDDEDFLNLTFDHCLWTNVWSRLPMARFGTIHILNNVYDCPGTVGINPRTASEFLVEGCVFATGTKPYCSYRTDIAPCKACVFRDNISDPEFEIVCKGDVSVPYEYFVSSPTETEREVRKFAGPTLKHPLKTGR